MKTPGEVSTIDSDGLNNTNLAMASTLTPTLPAKYLTPPTNIVYISVYNLLIHLHIYLHI